MASRISDDALILRNLRPIASLLLAAALLLAGNGAQFTLLPLRGQAEGFSTLALGLMGSAYYIGFVAGCLFAPPVVLRVGHIRAFTAMVAVAAATTLAYAMAPQPVRGACSGSSPASRSQASISSWKAGSTTAPPTPRAAS